MFPTIPGIDPAAGWQNSPACAGGRCACRTRRRGIRRRCFSSRGTPGR